MAATRPATARTAPLAATTPAALVAVGLAEVWPEVLAAGVTEAEVVCTASAAAGEVPVGDAAAGVLAAWALEP